MKSRMFRAGKEWDDAMELAEEGTEPRVVRVPLDGTETLSEALRKFLGRFVR